jgi:Leucine-rich repeat (LRR) protein
MGSMENLEYLNMSNNNIKDIHKSIAKLKKLKKIDLSNNKGVFGLNSLISMTELETLNLSGCNLLVFPYYITMMKKIKKLYLVGNGFNNLSSEITNLKSLQVLTLNEALAENLENTIEIISKLENLKEVYLPYIEIFKIPKNIIKLKYLKKLTLYPAILNRGKIPENDLLKQFMTKLENALEGCRVELIY